MYSGAIDQEVSLTVEKISTSAYGVTYGICNKTPECPGLEAQTKQISWTREELYTKLSAVFQGQNKLLESTLSQCETREGWHGALPVEKAKEIGLI